jgi:hypothetical protein
MHRHTFKNAVMFSALVFAPSIAQATHIHFPMIVSPGRKNLSS